MSTHKKNSSCPSDFIKTVQANIDFVDSLLFEFKTDLYSLKELTWGLYTASQNLEFQADLAKRLKVLSQFSEEQQISVLKKGLIQFQKNQRALLKKCKDQLKKEDLT